MLVSWVTALTYGFMQGWSAEIVAATAAIPTAIGTLVLAYYTSQSVKGATAAIEHDNQNQRIARTIDIRRRYVETPIPMSQVLSVPVQAIASNVLLYAADPDGLARLIALYHATPTVVDAEHNQFRLLVSAFTAIGNFYTDVATLLEQNLLDEYLLMDRFAGEFLNTYRGMELVAKQVRGTTVQTMQTLATDPILDRFGKKCDAFVVARLGSLPSK